MPRDREKVRANARRYARKRYATDPAYREESKARSREQWANKTPEEREAKRVAERAAYAEDEAVREDRKARARVAHERQQVKRQEVVVAYGGVCECCGTDFYPHLTIDHINGGGSAERASGIRPHHLIAKLWREGFPEGYRVLCWNCNWTAHRDGRCSCSD